MICGQPTTAPPGTATAEFEQKKQKAKNNPCEPPRMRARCPLCFNASMLKRPAPHAQQPHQSALWRKNKSTTLFLSISRRRHCRLAPPAARQRSVSRTSIARPGEHRKHSTRQQLRFGRNKGSLSVEIGRKNPGTWYDWSTDDSGDMFDLIRRERNCDFAEDQADCARTHGHIRGAFTIFTTIARHPSQ